MRLFPPKLFGNTAANGKVLERAELISGKGSSATKMVRVRLRVRMFYPLIQIGSVHKLGASRRSLPHLRSHTERSGCIYVLREKTIKLQCDIYNV